MQSVNTNLNKPTRLTAAPTKRQQPPRKVSKHELLDSLNEEQKTSLTIQIESILESKTTQYRLLLFIAGIILLFLIIGDILFIIK